MLPQETLIRYIRILSELSNQIRYAVQKRILIEVALIKLCKPQMDEKLQKIAKAGRELAMAGHTWEVRTKILEEIL